MEVAGWQRCPPDLLSSPREQLCPRGGTKLDRTRRAGKQGSVSNESTTITIYHSTVIKGTAEVPRGSSVAYQPLYTIHLPGDQSPLPTSDFRSWYLPASLSLTVFNLGQHREMTLNTRRDAPLVALCRPSGTQHTRQERGQQKSKRPWVQ